MKRRTALLAPLPLLAGRAWGQERLPGDLKETVPRLATTWRVPGAAHVDDGYHAGVLALDWAGGRMRLQADVALPSRAHGLLALPDGGFAVVANRPGRWLLRCDAAGRIVARQDIDAERPQRSFNGHVESTPDGRWVLTVETDIASGEGWIGVRDPQTLARVAAFPSHGLDPHHLSFDATGALIVVNGGIPRDAAGRKVELDRMAPSLVRLEAGNGRLLGRWQLPDPRLSLRHLAWAHGPAPLLGLALQAEHDDAAEREQAPLLAVWDGRTMTVPSRDASGGGYAGDIAAAPGGGFVLSAQKRRLGLWWHPGRPSEMTRVAELTEPCAMVDTADAAGVHIGAGRGVARWHARLAPQMLPWPMALAPDNHAVRLVEA